MQKLISCKKKKIKGQEIICLKEHMIRRNRFLFIYYYLRF